MNCLHCNKPIESKRSTKKYCSSTCKQYSYLQRVAITTLDIPDTKEIDHKSQSVIPDENKPTIAEPAIAGKKIRPAILSALEHSSFQVEYYAQYFSTENTGSVRPENFEAFGYVCKRICCVLENVLSLSHKRKVFYNTILILRKGLAETLSSAYYKQLPSDFPFSASLVHLFERLGEFELVLFKNKEGIKFSLDKKKMVHYINMLRMMRRFICEKQSFRELFPHYFTG